MVKGKTHFQQTSVIGLTNLPTQFAWTETQKKLKKISMNPHLLYIEESLWSPLEILTILMVAIVFFAMVFRHIPAIPEPNLRFRSPIGKLPFFDGVVIYGLMFVFGCFILKFIEMFL